jgi:hypothetical protein
VIGGHQPQPPPPRRVAVSGPRRHRAGGWSARAGAADLHTQPRLGQVYVRSLVRDQLRLAMGVLVVLALVLIGVPAAFALVPGLPTAEVFGFRLAWLLLGLVAYPVLVGLAWFHVRHAERVERDFTELLGEPDQLGAERESAPEWAPEPVTTAGTASTVGTGPAAGVGPTAESTATGLTGPTAESAAPSGSAAQKPNPGSGPDLDSASGPGSGSGPDLDSASGPGSDSGPAPDSASGPGSAPHPGDG